MDVQQSEGMCPLCQNFGTKSDSRAHSYETHVGHHLEQLALFVLPHHDENDEAGDLQLDIGFGRASEVDVKERASSDDGLLRELGPRGELNARQLAELELATLVSNKAKLDRLREQGENGDDRY